MIIKTWGLLLIRMWEGFLLYHFKRSPAYHQTILQMILEERSRLILSLLLPHFLKLKSINQALNVQRMRVRWDWWKPNIRPGCGDLGMNGNISMIELCLIVLIYLAVLYRVIGAWQFKIWSMDILYFLMRSIINYLIIREGSYTIGSSWWVLIDNLSALWFKMRVIPLDFMIIDHNFRLIYYLNGSIVRFEYLRILLLKLKTISVRFMFFNIVHCMNRSLSHRPLIMASSILI